MQEMRMQRFTVESEGKEKPEGVIMIMTLPYEISQKIAPYVQNAERALERARSAYDTDPILARSSLVEAERFLDEGLLEIGMTRYVSTNPCAHFYEQIMTGWSYLNSRVPLSESDAIRI